MKLRARLIRRLDGRLPASCRLPDGYPLEFVSARNACPRCGGKLRRVRTSIHRPVGLMIGRPRVRCVQKGCADCGWTDSCGDYRQWVPHAGNYAFDLMIEVGLARLRDLRQDAEIQDLLQQRWGLTLPPSAIGLLTDAFLDGLAAAHRAHVPALRRQLEQDGGFVMHLDGTCEPKTDVLFAAIAAPRAWTLAAAKLTSENVKEICQMLGPCVVDFGVPSAVMRDLSKNIRLAKEAVIPEVPDRICHYHFLENVGEKLCEKPHANLGKHLRRLKIRGALTMLRKEMVRWGRRSTTSFSPQQIQALLASPQSAKDLDWSTLRRLVAYALLRWVDDFGSDLHGEYFPFDLPNLAFYRRGCQLNRWLTAVLAAKDFPKKKFSTLVTMSRHLSALEDDAAVATAAERLEQAAALFNELREVLRLQSSPEHLLRGRSPKESVAEIRDIPQRLKRWRTKLQERMSQEKDGDRRQDQQTVLGYLKKYEDQLVGHVIELKGRSEPLMVSRTNNLLEHRFGRTKRGMRRKAGTKKLTRAIQAARPEVLLLPNLQDAAYLDIVYGGSLANLASVFAEHWPLAQAIRRKRQGPKTGHPMPTTKKQLRRPCFLEKLKQLLFNAIQQPEGAYAI